MLKHPPTHLSLISGLEWQTNPYAAFCVLREECPVMRVDWPKKGAGEWLVTRYNDAVKVLGSPQVTIRRVTNQGRQDMRSAGAPIENTLLTIDPPLHSKMRSIVLRELMAQVDRIAPSIETGVQHIVDRCPAEGFIDVVSDIAAPTAALIVGESCDFDLQTVSRMSELTSVYTTEGFVFGPGFVSPRVCDATDACKGEILRTIAERTMTGGSGLVGRLVRSVSEQFPDGMKEIVTNTILLVTTAGLQTTRHAISNSIHALAQDEGAWLTLADVPIGTAVEELLRYDGPSQAVGRVLTSDLNLAGVQVPVGAFMRVALASANRDPEQFENPDALDLARQPNHHIAFGFGQHTCAGASLARLGVDCVLKSIRRRYQAIALEPEGTVRDLRSVLRGFCKLRIRVDSRRMVASNEAWR